MHIVVRKDMGGYAAGLAAYETLAVTPIERPFLLLCGPNGSGKTALLTMIRMAMGLTGARSGRLLEAEWAGGRHTREAGTDLARLAVGQRTEADGRSLASTEPGVIDIAALGWRGQRSWLFDSRSETNLLSASTFGADMLYQASLLVGGGGKVSHGQALGSGWAGALRFGLGLLDAEDPYDRPGRLPDATARLWKAVTGPEGKRPSERWLLLDEPETALDANILTKGLAACVQNARSGELRVFCASHSPLFPAGLGDHPHVQVIDLGGGRSWYKSTKTAIDLARDPREVEFLGLQVLVALQEETLERKEAARKKEAAEVSRALKDTKKPARFLLTEALKHADHELPRHDFAGKKVADVSIYALETRGLVRYISRASRDPRAKLTPLGIRAATRLAKGAASGSPRA